VAGGRRADCPKFSPEACARIIGDGDVRNVFFHHGCRMLKAEGAEIAGCDRSHRAGAFGQRCWRGGDRTLGLPINEFYGQTNCNMVATASSQFPPARDVWTTVRRAMIRGASDVDGNPTKTKATSASAWDRASDDAGYWQRPDETAQNIAGGWMLTRRRGRIRMATNLALSARG